MIRTLVRRYLFGVLVLAAAGSSHAQTLETFAGDRLVDNLPALESPISPHDIMPAADGSIWFLNGRGGRLMRSDPATPTLTGWPAGAPSYPYERISHFFRGNTGTIYFITIGTVYQFDPVTGAHTWLGQIDQTTPTACTGPEANGVQFAADSNGVIYWADYFHHSACRMLPSGVIEKIAGFNGVGFRGDGGLATASRLNAPGGIAVDAANNVYIADSGNNRIRKITATTGIISTIAGNGVAAYAGENVAAAAASLWNPGALAFDAAGNLFVAESGGPRLRQIAAQTGLITTVAGNGQSTSNSPDGGQATQTALNWLGYFTVAGNNDILFGDSGRMRKITRATGIVSTIAGNGEYYFCGENATPRNTCLDQPRGIAIAANGDIYISDTANRRVRRYTAATGLVTTVAGKFGPYGQFLGEGGLATNAVFSTSLNDIALDAADNLYIAGASGNRVFRVSKTTGIITTIAGTGVSGFSGDGGPASAAQLNWADSVAVDVAGNVFISDRGNNRVRRVDAVTGIITTYAGATLGSGQMTDGIPATSAYLSSPHKVGFDPAGNLIIADYGSFRIRRVDKNTGIINTIIGQNLGGNLSGDGGPATAAVINSVASFAYDAAGNAFIVTGGRVRRIDATTGIITPVTPVQPGFRTVEGYSPGTDDMEFDAAGRLYFGSFDAVVRATGLPNPNNDTTPPVITPSVSGTVGPGGWYRSNALVTWTVTDTQSEVTSTSGCFAQIVSTDTSGVTYTCSATSSGGSASQSVTVRRDTVAPTLAFGTPFPAPTASGWYSGDVSLPFTASDALSGVFSTSTANPVVITGSGTNLSAQVVVTDAAGNSATFTSPLVKIDRSGPTVVATVSGTAGNDGWYRSDVQVAWAVTDSESTVTTQGCATALVTADTAGTTFTCTATSAGGSTSKTVNVKRDTTPPTLNFGAPVPAPGVDGWHGGDVSIPFTSSDALSGVESTNTASPVLITGTGANLTTNIIVKDVAGNQATLATPPVNIDRSPPVVEAHVSGTAGNDGWYRSDVQVSWSITGASTPSTLGCETASVVSDTAGITYTCTATSIGGETSQSVTVKRDATPPQLQFGANSPSPVIADWYGGPVTIPFTTADSLSGVATTSQASPVVITGPGYNLRTDVVVTDAAGNSATFTTTGISIDTSPPVVDAQLSGTLGNNGWYVSDVEVKWSESEDSSPVVSREGCYDLTLRGDSPGAIYSCTVNSVGGSTTKTITVKRDATPPWVTFHDVVPEPNGSGWYNSDVSIYFNTLDHVSGVVSSSVSSPALITGEGAGLTREIVLTDAAGNTASFTTPPVDIDRSAPSVLPIVSGTLGNNGWYTSDVQVGWVVNESPGNIISQTGCGTTSVTADTAGVTFICSVVSGGGSAGSSVTIKRDATAPVLTYGTITPAANANGWNKTNLSVPFTRSDAMSGLASTSATSPIVLSTEAAGVTAQVTVVDLAGNSATFTSTPRNIDKTAPYAEMETPEDAATYGFYADVPADFVCQDLSLVSCTAPVAQGAFINTASAGAKTFKVVAKDQAGFTTNHTHTYNVASGFNFDGFAAPLRAPSTLNLVTRGSLVPLRWRLPDGRGGFVTNPTSFVSATVSTFTCSGGSVSLNDVATGSEGLSFDAASGTFTYNWQTNASWTGCRKLIIKLKDNSTHEARFKFQ